MIRVHRDLEHLPHFKNAVVTIGTFDGVHLGHQQIIKLLTTEALAINGETVIITFYPHPRKIVASGKSDVKVLNTLDEKIELLEKRGVEHLVVVPFTDSFASQTAEEYVANFLVKKFYPHTIIIGYDHKFGNNRSGDYQLLEKLGEKFNYRVREIPEHVLNDITISSTRIREALIKSDVSTANSFLGYPYFFEGKVSEGNKLGRTIDYPTANLVVENKEKLVPANGVYAVTLTIYQEEKLLKGMMNIGLRPTVEGTKRTIEVNIFDFNEDVYGKIVRVYLHRHIRGEIKFDGLDQLKQQLAKDKLKAKEFLANF
jgi:riboflavin kinase/FMN adenylyltransferase